MMRSLFSGVSGLKSHQTRMDVIGNNISNINTVGFKSSRTTFADMLSQTSKGASSPTGTIGGTNPTQIGLGAAVASIDLITNDGSPQSTGKNTDVALSGNGMFVMKRGDSYYYTRDGAFEFDNDGNYVLPGSGLYVQGWNAVDGSLNTNADPVNIVVPAGRAMPATATTAVDFSGNLNASTPTITNITYTSGGNGTNPSAVVNGYNITGITYSGTYTVTTSTDTSVTYTLGQDVSDRSPYNVTNSNTDTTIGSTATTVELSTVTGVTSTIQSLILTLADGTRATISSSSGDTTTYAVSGNTSTGVTTSYNGQNITSIAYVGEMTGIQATAQDIVRPGSVSTYNGTPLMGLNTTSATLSLIDSNGSGATTTETVNAGGEVVSYKIYDSTETDTTVTNTYGTESVNVDGTNVIAAILTLSDGSTQKVTSGFYEVGHSIPVTTIVTIYDSEGKTHAVTMLIDKDAVSVDANANSNALALENNGKDNRWRIYLAPGIGTKGPSTGFGDMDGNTDANGNWTGTVESDGSWTAGRFNQSTTNPNGAVSFIYFNSDGSYNTAATDGGTMALNYFNGNGASPTTSSVNYTGLTQYSGNSTAYPTADGNSFGVLQSISIDTSGVLTGTYTNGILRFEAQLAVAQFINPAGLTKTGTSLYQQSNNSGTANIKTVTDLGLTITPSALEMSNVDLASELADMIVTQRGFQSNSKIITVGDEMLETLINMKR